VSVARVARRHAVNANQVFYWRKKYREGRLGKRQSSKLLPVTLSDDSVSKSGRAGCASSPFAVGTMEIKLSQGTLRVAGNVDVVVPRSSVCWDDLDTNIRIKDVPGRVFEIAGESQSPSAGSKSDRSAGVLQSAGALINPQTNPPGASSGRSTSCKESTPKLSRISTAFTVAFSKTHTSFNLR
jgi:hypothetical protein